LKAVKSELTSFAPQKQAMNASAYKPASKVMTSASTSSSSSSSPFGAPAPPPPVQSVEMKTDYVSKDQVQRLALKAKSQKKY